MANSTEEENPQGSAAAGESPDFEAWASRHLRATFPDETSGMPDEDLRKWVRSCAARSAFYGLNSAEQILCFAVVGLLIGSDFDSNPDHVWAAEVLADAELSADERSAMLVAIAEVLVDGIDDIEVGNGESG